MRCRPTTMDELRACLGAAPQRCRWTLNAAFLSIHGRWLSCAPFPLGRPAWSCAFRESMIGGASQGWSGSDLAVLFEEEPGGQAAGVIVPMPKSA